MRVYAYSEFWKEADKRLSQRQKQVLNRIIDNFEVPRGKRLLPWLWEIRLGEKRAYYVRNDSVTLLVAISSKNDQQRIIDQLKEDEPAIMAELKKLTAAG